MYVVVTMAGTDEPWWFFDGWQKDVLSVDEFDDFYQALKCYKRYWMDLKSHYQAYKSRDDLLTAFWESGDEEWCEECAGYLQRYHSVALLEDWHLLPADKKRWAYKKKSGKNPERFCRYKRKED